VPVEAEEEVGEEAEEEAPAEKGMVKLILRQAVLLVETGLLYVVGEGEEVDLDHRQLEQRLVMRALRRVVLLVETGLLHVVGEEEEVGPRRNLLEWQDERKENKTSAKNFVCLV
jgi:hypothetical protein